MKLLLAAYAVSIVVACALSPHAFADTSQSRNEQVIRAVFGAYGEQAVQVARCESGSSVWAHNPNGHDGLFQFGSYAKARYGFGWDVWAQSRAAYAYFKASGYRWTAWECRPAWMR